MKDSISNNERIRYPNNFRKILHLADLNMRTGKKPNEKIPVLPVRIEATMKEHSVIFMGKTN